MWKIIHTHDYPLKLERTTGKRKGMSTRQRQEDKYKEINRTQKGRQSFGVDATKLWNQAPDAIKKLQQCVGCKK
jgi:hypothetical protein